MKKIMIAVLVAVFSGCAVFQSQQHMPTPPAGYVRSESGARDVASNEAYVENAYRIYFNGQNFYQRVIKLENIAAQLHSVMPEKGHAKKKLVARFLADVRLQKNQMHGLSSTGAERRNSWLPSSENAHYSQHVRALGRIAASYKIMSRMGIYLSASGVFDADAAQEDFYLSLLDRATDEIERSLQTVVLVYKPEDKEADEAAAKLNYARFLASDVRMALTRVYPGRGTEYRRLDGFFRQVERADRSETRQLIRGREGRFVQSKLKTLHVMNSGDIQGFAEEMDLTISTKFGFEMIHQLVASE